jgi:hypothetical protein
MKISYAKNIYNLNHKYVHLVIKQHKFMLTIISRRNRLFADINEFIIETLNNPNNLENKYTTINMCLLTINAINRLFIIIKDLKDKEQSIMSGQITINTLNR